MLHLTRWSESFQRNKTSFDEWVKQISNYLFRTCQFTRFRIPFIRNICDVLSVLCTTPFAEFDKHHSSVFALPQDLICLLGFANPGSVGVNIRVYKQAGPPQPKFWNCGHGHEIFETTVFVGVFHWLLIRTPDNSRITPERGTRFSNFFVDIAFCNFHFDSFQRGIFVVKNF